MLPPVAPPPGRGIYCNRTLNLRAIRAIGYDMDYTLIHYDVAAWEARAFAYLKQKLSGQGWPVGDVTFDASEMIRGLVIDTHLGNIVKADRFGYVTRAAHGTRRLDFDTQRQTYGRALVDLNDRRWVFLNTFFSLSEAVMYAHLVDRLDAGRLPAGLGYRDVWRRIRQALDLAHAEGRMKAEMIGAPERFVQLDPEVVQALLDQRAAGKRLLLVTNSEWAFTRAMMQYAFDRFLPAGTSWRQLFDLVIVGARKPDFFAADQPLYHVVNDEGLLRPSAAGLSPGGLYHGGHAGLVEEALGLSGSDILFVGDHLYTDVRASRDVRRWRTCLIVRELEDELAEVARVAPQQAALDGLMARKRQVEFEQAWRRLQLQRRNARDAGTGAERAEGPEDRLAALREESDELDRQIAPLATALGGLSNERWGPLMSSGANHSLMARQLEDAADLYTSRAANFLFHTPYAYLRAPRGRMPHDAAESAAAEP
jgi:HAD superfamily 5'-nucleotidase-like hydrolase